LPIWAILRTVFARPVDADGDISVRSVETADRFGCILRLLSGKPRASVMDLYSEGRVWHESVVRIGFM
jgi:hypothetical protein